MPRYVGTVVRSIETEADFSLDLGHDEDELLAAALDNIKRRHSAPVEREFEEYETHRILEQSVSPPPDSVALTPRQSAPVEIKYEDILDEAFAGSSDGNHVLTPLTDRQRLVPRDGSPGKIKFADSTTDDRSGGAEDTRSPLERFRTPPKKPLSVTDFVSPAWCELQYWYSLVKFGRKRRTPAMKRGSTVHKDLEEQVHVTVPVDVQTREDTWGLRIWNIIQGLRTLRVTGMTRELELWGVVDGEVVNGIIDELSYVCPDSQLEAQLSEPKDSKKHDIQISPNQATLEEFFKSQSSQEPSARDTTKADRKIYLMDVKTRNSRTPPNGLSLKPTHMQLMLYRKLLASLASNDVEAHVVFKRYNLDPSRTISESLIEQLSGLEDNLDPNADENSYAPVESGLDACFELIQHNTLERLWQLMIQEFQKTMPKGRDTISKVLKVEFRASSDSKIITSRTFEYDDTRIERYLEDKMKWWRGERPAQGVSIAEAFKCRHCEFADDCEWRINKIDEAVTRHRTRPSGAPVETPEGVV